MKKGLAVLWLLSVLQLSFAANLDCQLTPGLADANVLALSWQPAFCETRGYYLGKPECVYLSAQSYSSHHLVLHGLWPNQQSCGVGYGFCGVEAKEHHCDYAPLPLADSVADALSQVMPSFKQGSCLERHEWNKHGSCQTLPLDNYFTLATRLVSNMNQTPLGQFIAAHVGEMIKKSDLEDKVRESFGENGLHKVYFSCHGNLLLDIYVQLNSEINESASLENLVTSAPDNNKPSTCKEDIMVSNFHTMD